MEKCYECYCENGLRDTGIKELGKYCGMTSANLYAYFDNVDDLIVQSTAYCMAKVEDEFMALAPENPQDILRFIDEIPHWTAKNHGKKYRLMHQVYTHPKYIEHGKKFFAGVNERYTEYHTLLEVVQYKLACQGYSIALFLFSQTHVLKFQISKHCFDRTSLKTCLCLHMLRFFLGIFSSSMPY